MITLRIDTEDRKILKAVRAILESFEVPFEEAQSESPYDPEFVSMVKESQQEPKEGKVVTFEEGTNLWELISTK